MSSNYNKSIDTNGIYNIMVCGLTENYGTLHTVIDEWENNINLYDGDVLVRQWHAPWFSGTLSSTGVIFCFFEDSPTLKISATCENFLIQQFNIYKDIKRCEHERAKTTGFN